MATLLPRLSAGLLLCPLLAASHAAPPGEYEVKAAFIHNIAKFVEWPAPVANTGKFTLCVAGEDPSGGAFAGLHGKPVGGMVWEVAMTGARANLRDCRVVFIAASEAANLRRILAALHGSQALTVADSEGFAEEGVMINFYLEQNKVRLEINADAARQAGLKLGAQLLRLSRVVTHAREAQ